MNTLKNSVQLIGHLGKDVELRETPKGTKVASLTMATNDYYKDNNGELVTETQWHNIVMWGKQAERAAGKLSKGSKIIVKGKLTHRAYEDKDGIKRYFSEVVVREWEDLSVKEKEKAPF